MHCPNCKQEFDGKFCPECGTKLIEKPVVSGGINVKLGDANAISGGVHLADSHNVHNEDHSVHNITNTTSTINNITQVAAQKTEIEILQEKKTLYLNECKRAYEDNVLEQSEVIALEECRIKLGLDKSTANTILESVRVMSERNARKTELNPIARTKLKILTDNLQKNEVKALMQQIDSLEPLVNRYEHDELRRKYFLVLAALKSEKCIAMYENTKTDNYWNTFWSYLAYIKVGRLSEAEDALASLDRFTSYPEDNMTVLAVAGAIMMSDDATAKELLNAVTGDYTPALQRFVDSIYLILEPETAKEMGADENTCAFYLVNFFGQKDAKAKAEEERLRKEAEEEECSVFDVILQTVGEAKLSVVYAVSEICLIGMYEAKKLVDSVPCTIKESIPQSEAEAIKQELESAGATVILRAKDANAKAEEEQKRKEAEAECSVFDVILQSVGGAKLSVVNAVVDICLIGIYEAKKLVDSVPSIIKENVPQTEADAIKRELESVGATVILRAKNANTSDYTCESNDKKEEIEYNYHPKTKEELQAVIKELINKRGEDADLNDIDVSKITDMSNLFRGIDPHNIDISKWDVSNVIDMNNMFSWHEDFNSDLSRWDVSNVENMACMFQWCDNFNCDLSGWDVSKVTNMSEMFQGCYNFEGKGLENWDVSSVTDMDDIFDGCDLLKEAPSWLKNDYD